MVKEKNKSKAQRSNERRAIKDWPASERLREKLLQLGPEGLSDGELLAVLLRIDALGQSAEDLARHPSGRPKPSPADDHTTEVLKQVADLMDLAFLDHLIMEARMRISVMLKRANYKSAAVAFYAAFACH